jgi:hypothetical protein
LTSSAFVVLSETKLETKKRFVESLRAAVLVAGFNAVALSVSLAASAMSGGSLLISPMSPRRRRYFESYTDACAYSPAMFTVTVSGWFGSSYMNTDTRASHRHEARRLVGACPLPAKRWANSLSKSLHPSCTRRANHICPIVGNGRLTTVSRISLLFAQ